MTIEAVLIGIIEIIKLINFYNSNLSPDEAKVHTARLAKVLDFLFGWLDKHPAAPQIPPTVTPVK